MSHTQSTHTDTDAIRRQWAGGLTVFGAVMLMIAGVLGICRGIMAIAEDDVFVTTRKYIFEFDLTGWGWIHLIVGVVALIVSFGLFTAMTWARVAGVAIAALLIIANFLSLPYYPAWSLVVITASAFIIWALCVVRPDDL
ncbi:DUF7144 family membrane protein [Streptomyces sp. NPDC055287]